MSFISRSAIPSRSQPRPYANQTGLVLDRGTKHKHYPYAFCQFENLIIVPQWWDSLSVNAKQALVNAASSRFYPRNLKKLCDWGLTQDCSSEIAAVKP